MRQRGAASVEYVALVALIGIVVAAACLSLSSAGGRTRAGGELAGLIGRRIACAPRLPGPCRRDPLTVAYGRSVAGAVRDLAPRPSARRTPAGSLVPVDFRRCRQPSCAIGGAGDRLTRAGRRTTAFTSVEDGRRAHRPIRISYWLYRPSLPWERVVRTISPETLARYARVPLTEDQVPALVPLETLDGRNHVPFSPVEEPPWRWRT